MAVELPEALKFLFTYQTSTHLGKFLSSLFPDIEDSRGYVWGPCPIHGDIGEHGSYHYASQPEAYTCASERIIQIACIAASRPRLSYEFDVSGMHLWVKTLYRIITFCDPVAATFVLTLHKPGDLDHPWANWRPKSCARTQYKIPRRHGRSRDTYRTRKVHYLKELRSDLKEEVEYARQSCSSLFEVIELLRALHACAKDRTHGKLLELERCQQELRYVQLQMMMVDNMPESKAGIVLAPERERLDLESRALRAGTAFRNSESTRLWLQRHVIKPLEKAMKGWMAIIQGYEHDMLGLEVLIESFKEMSKE